MKPMVSIIVPIYNASKTLARCVDSILNQEYTDFELLLMDDGSRDESSIICDEYAAKDTRVRVIHKENSGVSATRNMALDMAEGKYLQFLDSDDWITPNATKLLVDAAEQNGCDMVIADFYRVVGERVSHKGAIEGEGILSREAFAEEMMENPADFYYGVLWNKLFRRDIVEKNKLRMDEKLSWCEDFLFNLEYIRYCEKLFVLQVPIYYYVRTKGSLASQGMSITKTVKMKLMLFEYYTDFYKQVLTEEEYQKKRLQVYRFLVDSASDGTVLPTVMPGTKKLGEERIQTSQAAIDADGVLMHAYRDRKLLDYYMEPVAIRYELSINEMRILLCLCANVACKDRRELAEISGVSYSNATIALQHLAQRGFVRVTKKRGKEALTARFYPEAKPILEELNLIQTELETAKLAGLSEEEVQQYQQLSERIKQNMQKIL